MSKIFPGFPNLEAVNLGIRQVFENIKGILKNIRRLVRKRGGMGRGKWKGIASNVCFRSRSSKHSFGKWIPRRHLSLPPLLDAEGKLCISADWQTPKKGSLLLELTQLVNLGPVKEKRRKTKTPPKAIHKERS